MSGIQAADNTPSMEGQFGEVDMRACTCHPDDNPPVPCPRKYALSDCRLAALVERLDDQSRRYQTVILTLPEWATARAAILSATQDGE